MLTTVCDRPAQIELPAIPVPEIDDHKVLVQVSRCGIWGADLPAFQGTCPRTYPYAPGHESCGTVVDLGAAVRGLETGRRVIGERIRRRHRA